MSTKPTRAKRAGTASMSEHGAKAVRIDWARVDGATEADVGRHAREDRTRPPSDRAWQRMVENTTRSPSKPLAST
jgi:hypothetical protein